MYNYFVSYCFKQNLNNHGFGYMVIALNAKITAKTVGDCLAAMHNTLAKEKHLNEAVVLSFQLLDED